MSPKLTPEQTLSNRNRKWGYQLTNWLPLEETVRHLEPFFSNEQEIGVHYCIKREGVSNNYSIWTSGEFIGEGLN